MSLRLGFGLRVSGGSADAAVLNSLPANTLKYGTEVLTYNGQILTYGP
jgi:hypothetical protein